MDTKLLIQALTKLISGFIILALLLFIPAGTLNYPNAWLFLAVLFIPMIIVGIITMIKNPELLKKRLNAKEKEAEQKKVVLSGGIMFILGFVISGLNYRFQWLMLPKQCVIAAAVIFLVSYGLYAEVMRENTYLSRTIEVQENQHVVDTGLYGIVRHPMYSATVFMFLSIPLMLGSLISLAVFLAYIPLTVKRIKNEEEVLERELDGYSEYMKKVKYRIIPFIW